jgi:hypothetical protein
VFNTNTRVVTTLAGQLNNDGSADGMGAAASFVSPSGVATASGVLYVADTFANTLRAIALSNNNVITFVGKAFYGGYLNGVGTNAKLNKPSDLAMWHQSLFVADMYNQVVRRVDLATAAVTTLAGYPGVCGSFNGASTAATFCMFDSDPTPRIGFSYNYYQANLIADNSDTGQYLYVVDVNNNVRQVDIVSGYVTTIAGTASGYGNGGFGNGVGTNAKFDFNTILGVGLAWLNSGSTLLISDNTNTIRLVDIPTKTVSLFAGVPAASSGYMYG